MALAAIYVKKPREAQIWNYCTGNPVLRILPDSNDIERMENTGLSHAKNESHEQGKDSSFVGFWVKVWNSDIQAAGLVLVVVFKSGLKELHELVHIFIVGIR